MKIKGKLRIYTILVSILPIILLGIISIWKGTKTLVKSETRTVEANIKRGKDMLNTVIDNAIADIETLSIIQRKNQGNIDLIESTYKSIAKAPEYGAVYFGSAKGDMYLYPIKNREDFPDNYHHRIRPWYIGAKEKQGDLFISEPYLEESGNTIMTISQGVYDKGNLLGVIGIDIDWGNFQKQISKMKIANEGHMFVLFRNGITLVHPDENLVGNKILSEFDFGRKILESKSGNLEYKQNGTKSFVIFDNIEKLGLIIAGGTTYKDISSNFIELKNLIIAITMIIILLSAIAIYIFGKDIRSGLNTILEIAINTAEGDFSNNINIKRDDEIGITAIEFKKTIEKQSIFLKQIQEKGLSLADISDMTKNMLKKSMDSIKVISNNMESLNLDIQTNSSSVNQASNGIAEVSESSMQVEKLSQNIGDAVKKANEKAQNGQKGIEKIMLAMDNITETIQMASRSSEELSEQTEEIRNFVTTIRNISEQTNLLALNAAIEAARAGDAGKGFAVVADEIRSLAENSQKATEDIERIIDDLVLKSDEVAEETEDGEIQAKKGHSTVREVGKEFKLIIEKVNGINDMVDDIVSASEEQSAATRNMENVINDINSVLKNSEQEVKDVSDEVITESKVIEKIKNLSEELENMSNEMAESLSQFKFSNK
ncbi:MAG: methyl-accepting chemotaxis protein [Fusobacteriota bacterium]